MIDFLADFFSFSMIDNLNNVSADSPRDSLRTKLAFRSTDFCGKL